MPEQRGPGNGDRSIAEALENLVQRRPVLEPILRTFGEILRGKARLTDRWVREGRQNRLDLDCSRLNKATPLLAGISLEALQEELSLSFAAILPVLKRTFGHLEGALAHLETFHRECNLDLSALSRAWLDGNSAVLKDAAQSFPVPEGVLGMVISMVLAPVLEVVALPFGEQVQQTSWLRGYCPICGSMPSISFLARVRGPASEFLVGGGGQKYLHCSVCGCEWRTKRNMCPACENEDKAQIYYQTPEDPSERVDVCSKCGAYLPCIDLREKELKPSLDMAAVGMVHLDVWARQKGYHPLAWTLWNQVD
jgi:FdhE protein